MRFGGTRGEREGITVRHRENDEWLRDLGRPGPDRESALAALRDRLMLSLRAVAVKLGADNAMLEDAVQNALLLVLSRLETFNGTARFTTWATTIAVHALLTESRRRRWADVSLEAAIAGGDSAPDVDAERSEMLTILDRLIREDLTDRQRTVILSELNGVPLEEIARRLSVTKNAVYKLGHDARRKLKAGLEALGFEAADVSDLRSNSAGVATP